MKKLIILFTFLFQTLAFAQNVNVITPTLQEGAFHFYWWLDLNKKAEQFKKTSLNKSFLKKGLNVLERPVDEKLWSKFSGGVLDYVFFTNIEKPIQEKFLIQRIKKTVSLYNRKGKLYSEKVTYLVEAFKTWTGHAQVEGTIKKADTHTGSFSSIGKKKRKVITKVFETGVGTIDGIVEDTSVWPFDSGSLYFGTKYNNNSAKKLYDKVRFTDYEVWTLNVEVQKNSYKIESPELMLLKQK